MGRPRKNIEIFGEGAAAPEYGVQVAAKNGELGTAREVSEETPMAEYVAVEELADQLECPTSKIELMALSEDRSEEWVRYNENGKMKLHPDVVRIIELKEELGVGIEDVLTQYLKQSGSRPLLTLEEEHYWARQFAEHRHLMGEEHRRLAERAREELINRNLRLVVPIAKRYRNRGIPLEDAIQIGNIGLIKAIDKLDAEKAKISTYSYGWIKQKITRALMGEVKMVRIPEHMALELNKMHRAEQQVWQAEGRKPEREEIAERLGKTTEKVRKMEEADQIAVFSMDRPITLDSETPLRDMLGDKQKRGPAEEAVHDLAVREVEQALMILTPPERRVIELYFGLDGVGGPMKLEEIGRMTGVSRQRADQLKLKALRKLRRSWRLRGAGEVLEEE